MNALLSEIIGLERRAKKWEPVFLQKTMRQQKSRSSCVIHKSRTMIYSKPRTRRRPPPLVIPAQAEIQQRAIASCKRLLRGGVATGFPPVRE
jgi:hypothetical protein